MNIGKRSSRQLFRAIFGKQHYIALFNMIRFYPNFIIVFFKYFFGIGKYPHVIRVKTPLGIISINVYSYYDILTVNEIFCRLDYKADKNIKVILDLGSNIGISALYFLTINSLSKCYLFEPVPENIVKLKSNLKEFEDRYMLEEVAVSNKKGIEKFGIDPYGRCGGLLRKSKNYFNVNCVDINDVLKKVFKKEKKVDILKIDTEGNEFIIVNSIKKEFLRKIDKIFIEIDYSVKIESNYLVLPNYYNQIRYGNMILLTSKNIIKI